MLKKIQITVFSLMLMTQAAFASDLAGDAFEASGKVGIGLQFPKLSQGDVWANIGIGLLIPVSLGMSELDMRSPRVNTKSKTVNVGVTVVVQSYGEDRINVALVSDSKNKCSPIATSFIGVGTPNGTYELYPTGVEDNVTPVATMLVGPRKTIITLTKELKAVTTGYRSQACVWTFPKDVAIVLKREK